MLSAIVIGDTAVDRYMRGVVERISSDTHCPIVSIKTIEEVAGCAANVAVNLDTLGNPVKFLTVLGGKAVDRGTKKITSILVAHPWITPYVQYSVEHITPIKTRVVDSEGHCLLRYDEYSRKPFRDHAACEKLMTTLENLIIRKSEHHNIGCIILSDYAAGTIADVAMYVQILRLADSYGIPLIVDPKACNLPNYSGCTILTPSADDVISALGTTRKHVSEYAADLCNDKNIKATLITAGAAGMYLARKDNLSGVEHIPTYSMHPVCDTTGAGDTVVACIAHEICQNKLKGQALLDAMPEIAKKASIGAGIVVAKPGTAALHRNEYLDAQAMNGLCTPSKFTTVTHAQRILKVAKEQGKCIVFTNGCFDVLHPGHVHLLTEARRHGDLLVVGINSNESVRKLKGAGRPIQPLTVRVKMLLALSVVDLVVAFDADTPEAVVRALAPRVLVKGAEYATTNLSTVPGAEFVVASGGRVIFVPMFGGYSTTKQLNS